jgi:hypothetical protein
LVSGLVTEQQTSLFPREQPPSRGEKVQRLMSEKKGQSSAALSVAAISGEILQDGITSYNFAGLLNE